jgi:uncharacterized protein (DUF362 family)/Pyruvate/2-oxoacid:ferredoxin oxidoreductase delta subunit
VKRRGGVPVIADSPGGPYTKQMLKSVYVGTGMDEIATREGALLNFDLGTTPMSSNGGLVCSSFDIINPVAKADVVISAAKLKTHGQMIYSGAVKNLFGSLPGLVKPEFHFRYPEKPIFGDMLVDLCETIKPAISFIDGIIGMEGNGPSGGEPKELFLTLASCNPHSLDLYACDVVGFKPDDIPTLASAVKRKLCPSDISELEIKGDVNVKQVKFKAPDSSSLDFASKLPSFIRRPITNLLTPRPAIMFKKCIGCGKCAESCPQHIISIVESKAVIDYSKCIKCYCCHEMCPIRAIEIKRFKLFG